MSDTSVYEADIEQAAGDDGTIFNRFPALTQAGDAERFAHAERGLAYFCGPEERWYLWTGRRYAPDRGRGILDLVFRHERKLIADITANVEDKKLCTELLDHVRGLESINRVRGMLEFAKAFMPILPEDLDRNHALLNCRNGAVDLQTGELVSHDRDHRCSKLVDIDYLPDAECPLWLAFIDRVMASDSGKITFLQRAAGYSLSGWTGAQVWFLLWGGGANGKSVFLRVLRAIGGEYAQQIQAATLLVQRRDGGAPSPDLAGLKGARIVTASEPEQDRRLADSLIKELTGEDTLSARHLHAEPVTFTPTAKVWLAANHKPEVRDSSLAMWRRVRLVPFTVTIAEEERDPDLYNKLVAELPGILAWAIRGCLAFQRDGLQAPDAVRNATEDYRRLNNPLERFIDECCERSPTAEVANADLVAKYAAWAAEAGEEPLSARALSPRLTEAGFDGYVSHHARYWMGLGLRHESGGTP